MDCLEIRWRAQPEDTVGGWCVTPADDPRKPSEGARMICDFPNEAAAKHIANLHNAWLLEDVPARWVTTGHEPTDKALEEHYKESNG